jgi:phosphoribosylformylglycinamidine cyclo-ligase
MTSYKDAGVDIELGDDVSKMLYMAAKETWKNRKGSLGELVVPFDDFTGVRAIDVSMLPKGTLMNIGFDGVGTKMELAERLDNHTTIAYDLFAMVCDDAVVRGAEPVIVGSILDVRSLGENGGDYKKQVRELAQGYIGAANAANVAVVNGEVAELGDRVGGYNSKAAHLVQAHSYIGTNLTESNVESMKALSHYLGKTDEKLNNSLKKVMNPAELEFVESLEKMLTLNYNWGAAVVWFAKKDRMFTGREIVVGDYLVGIEESGFRSNGLSLTRKVLSSTYGVNWHKMSLNGKSFGEQVLHPSTIYSKAIVNIIGGYSGVPKAEVHGIAHITGGGLPGKVGRMLKPSGYGATINTPLEPCNLMHLCQEVGSVPDEKAYETWNMGQGMVVATPEPEKVIKLLKKSGLSAVNIGSVVREPGVRIKSKGNFSRRKVLSFA